MNRRVFLAAVSAPGVLAVLRPLTTFGQDVEFERALERAQRDRPKTLDARARIAPPSEPGDPLVVHGRAVAEDGKTPIRDAVIFAYHTDTGGLYDRPEVGPHSWRLRGWVKTAADGTFEFTTIRPGAYPGRTVAQHIHLNIYSPDGKRYGSDELLFADDPLLPSADKERACQVRRQGAVQHVDFTFRLKPANKF